MRRVRARACVRERVAWSSHGMPPPSRAASRSAPSIASAKCSSVSGAPLCVRKPSSASSAATRAVVASDERDDQLRVAAARRRATARARSRSRAARGRRRPRRSRLPGCGSAWNTPASSTWRVYASSTRPSISSSARRPPRRRRRGAVRQFVEHERDAPPSHEVLVSTRPPQSAGTGCGTAMRGCPRRSRDDAPARRASRAKSVSAASRRAPRRRSCRSRAAAAASASTR